MKLENIVDRNSFIRAALVAQNRLKEATERKVMTRTDFNTLLNVPDAMFQTYVVALVLLERIHSINTTFPRYAQSRLTPVTIAQTRVAFILASVQSTPSLSRNDWKLLELCDDTKAQWESFVSYCAERHKNTNYWVLNRGGVPYFNMNRYLESEVVLQDVRAFFMGA